MKKRALETVCMCYNVDPTQLTGQGLNGMWVQKAEARKGTPSPAPPTTLPPSPMDTAPVLPAPVPFVMITPPPTPTETSDTLAPFAPVYFYGSAATSNRVRITSHRLGGDVPVIERHRGAYYGRSTRGKYRRKYVKEIDKHSNSSFSSFLIFISFLSLIKFSFPIILLHSKFRIV